MLTTQIGNTKFLHNGNFSGDVDIVIANQAFTVPYLDLKGFIVEAVRTEKITRLEEAEDDEVLGL